MKLASIFCIGILVLWVLLAIFDMWFNIMPWEVFIKITITFGLLIVVALGVALAKREYIDEKEMKKDKYIDWMDSGGRATQLPMTNGYAKRYFSNTLGQFLLAFLIYPPLSLIHFLLTDLL